MKHTSPSLKFSSSVGAASALKGSVVGKLVETVKVMLLSVSVDFCEGRERGEEGEESEREKARGRDIIYNY